MTIKKRQIKLPQFIDKAKHPYLWYIEWLDHAGFADGSWKTSKEVNSLQPIKIATVGWAIFESDEYVNVSPHLSEGGDSYGTMTIIKGCILKTKRLHDPNTWIKEIME